MTDHNSEDGFWYRGKVKRRTVLGYGVSAGALGAGILAALWPAWQAYRLDVAATLADG